MQAVQQDDSSRPRPVSRGCEAGTVFLLVFLVGLSLSAAAAYALEQNRRAQMQDQFQRLAGERVSRIANQFKTSQQQVESLSRHLSLAGDQAPEPSPWRPSTCWPTA